MKYTRSYFEDYALSRELLRERARELEVIDQLDNAERAEFLSNSVDEIKARLREICRTIDNYVTPDTPEFDIKRRKKEQLFLYYYYILDKTMEETAELLGVSRDTVFRIKKRLLAPAKEDEEGTR